MPVAKSKKDRKVVPLWRGPAVDGVTQSLLSRFLVCRERFRLLVVHGLKPEEGFNHRLEYGNMWHLCEELYADHKEYQPELHKYCQQLCRTYKTQQSQVEHWYNVCLVQFPLYVKHWAQHPDVKSRLPLAQEVSFEVPYPLPDGRQVTLRGKWDSVDLIGNGKNARVYLQENKTKGDINEQKIKGQLQFDLQTMLYLTALRYELANATADHPRWRRDHGPPAGVRYNVVRRPLSGGKGTIRQHKPTKSNPKGESKAAFYERVAKTIRDEPEHFFMRMKVEVTSQDIQKFEEQTLVPVLTQLCDWWEAMQEWDYDPWKNRKGFQGIHWRHPFGVYNVLNEGGSSELDEYLATGSDLGLQRTRNLFPEL